MQVSKKQKKKINPTAGFLANYLWPALLDYLDGLHPFKVQIGWPLGITWGFPGGSDGKASAYNVGDLGSIPGSGRSPGEGKGNSL